MKSLSEALLVVLAILFSLPVSAQYEVEVYEGKKSMSKGEVNSYYMTIPGIDNKTLDKEVERFLKKEMGVKPEKVQGEYFAPQVINERISHVPMNIYTRYYETESGILLMIFFEDVEGFISSDNSHEKASVIKKILHEFGEDLYAISIENQLKQEKDEFSNLQKELESLIKDKDKLIKDIFSYRRDIERLEHDIEVNESDQQRVFGQILDQKDRMLTLQNASEEVKDEQEKHLKELEREEKKLLKDNENMHKKIHDLEAKIREADREIERNESSQEFKKRQIEAQKEEVRNLQMKLK